MARKSIPIEPVLPSLVFKQNLKGNTNTELLKKLKLLHKELSLIDQERIEIKSLDSVAKDLILPSLLLHKEKGVKAFLACCLVDILRLYAPEAPYSERELKDIFQFLFRQLRHLTTVAELHFEQYFYVIESLSNVKSIVIICDLDSGDELMAHIFKQSFDVITSSTPKNVQICMLDLLTQILEETSSIPADVIDSLLAQFLPKNVKQKQTAYKLAVDVCTFSTDKLQRYVCQYFAEVINSATTGEGNDSEDGMDEDEVVGKGKKPIVKELPAPFITAHTLIKQLNQSVPGLLLNVIPQLEEELTASNPAYRQLSTKVLGEMIGEPNGSGDLAKKYPNTWKEWLRRHKDKIVAVRIAMVERLGLIWKEHPELGADIERAMLDLLVDPDDKVRVAACTVFEEIDYETASHHVNKALLVAYGERCKDKKPNVRAVAFKSLGRLYDLAFSEIEQRDPHAISQFSWIPNAVLESTLLGADPVTQSLIRGSIDETLHTYLLPTPKKGEEDEAQWVDRLLVVVSYLQETQLKALCSLTRLGERRPTVFEAFITVCEQHNGGVIDQNAELVKANLKKIIKAVASRLPNPTKAADDLGKFAKANEKQLYKLFRIMMDVQSDLKLLMKSYKDILKRLESISTTIVETFISFIRSSSLLLINRSSIPTLLKRLQPTAGSENDTTSKTAFTLLDVIARRCPSLFKVHTAELVRVLNKDSDKKVIEIALHALSKISKADNGTAPEKKVSEKAKEFARSSTSATHAKHAATIIALDASRPGVADDLVEFLVSEFENASDSDLVAHLSALARLAKFAPKAMEDKSIEITTFAVKILTRATVPGEQPDDDEVEWLQEEETDDLTKARVLAVKLLTNKCLAYAEHESAVAVATPVFTMLWQLLQQRNAQTRYSRPTESRLRLAAAMAVLKLATKAAFQNEIARNFTCLARTAQDSCFEVRSVFIARLVAYLRSDKINQPRYNMILFLVAHDPEDEIKQQVQSYVVHRANRSTPILRQGMFEHTFVRLIHLIAHHVDFEGDANDVDEIKSVAKYIEWYLQCLATQENVSYLYHLALRIKSIRDVESEGKAITMADRKLYILSDLTQHLIKCLTKEKGWPISTHPQQAPMPGDIFRKLSDAVIASQIGKKAFISSEVLNKVASSTIKISKTFKAKPESKPKVEKDSTTTPKKRKSPKASTSKVVKRNKKDDWNSEDDSPAESAEENENSEEEEEDGDATPKAKKSKTTPKQPAAESKRAGLRGSGGATNGSNGKDKSKVKEVETRAAVKGLAAPRALKRGKRIEVDSDLSGDDDDDDENEMDED